MNLIEVDSSLIKFIQIQITVFFLLLQSGTMSRRVYKHLSSALCLEVSTCNIFFASFFVHKLYRICLQDCFETNFEILINFRNSRSSSEVSEADDLWLSALTVSGGEDGAASG